MYLDHNCYFYLCLELDKNAEWGTAVSLPTFVSQSGQMKFGLRIKKLQKYSGKSVKEVAADVGVSVSTYREWENGRKIQGEPYEKIAKSLGVSIQTLLSSRQKTSPTVQDFDLNLLSFDLLELRSLLQTTLEKLDFVLKNESRTKD